MAAIELTTATASSIADLAGKKLLMVASTGGHLTQLHRLAQRLEVSQDSLWVTFDSPQSRSLLAGKRLRPVAYIAPRDARGVMAATRQILRITRSESFDGVLSTGAGLALSALPAAVRHRLRFDYVESVSRVTGPSTTGKILYQSRYPVMWTQHAAWARRRWRSTDAVLSSYRRVDDRISVDAPNLFVTLGTIQPYRFDDLVDAVLASGLANERTVWQLGCTVRTDLPGTLFQQMPREKFIQAARAADVVISHAGVGSVLDLLENGIFPVIVPRSAEAGEHVDNHQFEIAGLLERQGLANVTLPRDLSREAIVKSAFSRIV